MRRVASYWQTLKDFLKILVNLDVKRVTGLLVVIYAVYYGVEGFRRTVFSDFIISPELANELAGVDGRTLAQQLIVEIQNIRKLQESSGALEVNLIKGLKGFHIKDDPLQTRLSVRLNTDYRALIRNVGTFEWGPFEIPAALLLRPFQKIIRQTVVQLTLQRVGDTYRVLATSDTGAVWQSSTRELAAIIHERRMI